MKSALVVLSLCALVALFSQMLRLGSGSLTKWIAFYALAQFVYMVISWRSAAWWGWSSMGYAKAFYSSFACVAVVAIILSLKFVGALTRSGTAAAIAELTLAFVAGVCWIFILALRQQNMLNPFSGAHIVVAGVIVFCGALTLISMAFPGDLINDIVRIFLGSYWLAFGLYAFSEPAMYLRGRAEAVAHMSVAPLVISAVLFSGLALAVNMNQSEVSRQITNSAAVEARGIGR